MALNHRRSIAIIFYRNTRELSELELREGLERIAKVQRDTDVDADQPQRALQPPLLWVASPSRSCNLARVTKVLWDILKRTTLPVQ